MPELPVPPWKFWHPLPFWQAFLICFVAQLVPIFVAVALRHEMGIPVPVWVASGLGGVLGVAAVGAIATKRRAQRGPRQSA